ncbi:hypothetical protein GOP47_0027228 [Adiantum capillus-veneris]|nr:hypothetical protein GOP47_0027228 [Adiantum capillus-veneris]
MLQLRAHRDLSFVDRGGEIDGYANMGNPCVELQCEVVKLVWMGLGKRIIEDRRPSVAGAMGGKNYTMQQ